MEFGDDDDFQKETDRKMNKFIKNYSSNSSKNLLASEAPRTIEEVKRKFFQLSSNGTVSNELTKEFAAIQSSS